LPDFKMFGGNRHVLADPFARAGFRRLVLVAEGDCFQEFSKV
jgi:hypothetical protein